TGAYGGAVDGHRTYFAAGSRLRRALEQKGDLDGAIAEARQILRLRNQDLDHVILGILLKQKGLLDDAIACFRKAVELNPKNHIHLGLALQDKGQVDDAIACYRKSIELRPVHTLSHFALGGALLSKGLLDEAAAAFREYERLTLRRFRRSFRQKPHDPRARDTLAKCLNYLAWHLVTFPQRDPRGPGPAVSMAREAVELWPPEGDYHSTL